MKILLSSMRGVLLLGTSVLIVATLLCSEGMAEQDMGEVVINLTIPTYLSVNVQEPTIVINPVLPHEFYREGGVYPLLHTGSSLVDVRSNITCSLRVPMTGMLTHSTGQPTVPVLATIQMIGANYAYPVEEGSMDFWYLDFQPGIGAATSLVVSVQQVWTAEHTAGLYSGIVQVELIERIP